MRVYNPDLSGANDDFATRHFDNLSRNMGHDQVASIDVGPEVIVHSPFDGA